MLETVTSDAQKIIDLTKKRLEKTPPLEQILKESPELRGFFRYVARYDLRLKAAKLIAKKLAN